MIKVKKDDQSERIKKLLSLMNSKPEGLADENMKEEMMEDEEMPEESSSSDYSSDDEMEEEKPKKGALFGMPRHAGVHITIAMKGKK